MKKIIIIILVIVIVLSSGIYAVYNNYQLGQELYRAAQNTSILTHDLADGIELCGEAASRGFVPFSVIDFFKEPLCLLFCAGIGPDRHARNGQAAVFVDGKCAQRMTGNTDCEDLCVG